MNVQKSVAVDAAMLITVAGMAGIVNYSNAAATAASRSTINASAVRNITILPTITVTPSPAVLREIRASRAATPGSASASVPSHDAGMPYYSFGSDQAGA